MDVKCVCVKYLGRRLDKALYKRNNLVRFNVMQPGLECQQSCAGKGLTISSLGENVLIRNVCQFLWCKYSHHGPFQTNNMMSLNVELEIDVHNWLLFTGGTQFQQTVGCQNFSVMEFKTK